MNKLLPKRKAIGAPIDTSYFYDRSIPEPNTGCWLWLGAVSLNGYGVIRKDGKAQRAHRASYFAATGVQLSSGIDVCHRCDTRCCVNADHLFPGTRKDNMRDCANKGRIRLPNLSGEDCPASRLTAAEVLRIRQDARSNRQIAINYGVDKGTIAGIKNRTTWKSL